MFRDEPTDVCHVHTGRSRCFGRTVLNAQTQMYEFSDGSGTPIPAEIQLAAEEAAMVMFPGDHNGIRVLSVLFNWQDTAKTI